jgi:hypothetical protein
MYRSNSKWYFVAWLVVPQIVHGPPAPVQRRGCTLLQLRQPHLKHIGTVSTFSGTEAASNYAITLLNLQRFEEAKGLLRKTMPVARRVLGESNDLTLRMRTIHAATLYHDPDATLDYLREAVTRLEDTERIARRVLGGANPLTGEIEKALRQARAALRARETTPPPDAVAAS